MNDNKAKAALIWALMLRRCYAPFSKPERERHRDRNIGVDRVWWDFERFYLDMYVRRIKPLGRRISLDRTDNDKDYGPENCQWATPEQQSNNRSNNRLVTIDGETKTAAQWSRISGISQGTICSRLDADWTPKQAVFGGFRSGCKNNQLVTYKGETKSLGEWAKETGIRRSLLYSRLFERNWDVERAFTEPVLIGGALSKGKTRVRKNSVFIEHDGRLLSISQWSRKTGIPVGVLSQRNRAGWSPQLMLTTTVGIAGQNSKNIRKQRKGSGER